MIPEKVETRIERYFDNRKMIYHLGIVVDNEEDGALHGEATLTRLAKIGSEYVPEEHFGVRTPAMIGYDCTGNDYFSGLMAEMTMDLDEQERDMLKTAFRTLEEDLLSEHLGVQQIIVETIPPEAYGKPTEIPDAPEVVRMDEDDE